MNSGIRYVSTRADSPTYSFKHALSEGLAPDGGLFVPADYPRAGYSSKSNEAYATYASHRLQTWFPNSDPTFDIDSVCEEAFSFPIKLVRLSGPSFRETFILELFHGPTLSFKDFGARFMAGMLASLAENRETPLTILVATSGDTGSAVADAFSGLKNVNVILLYPRDQISPMQEMQLTISRNGVIACRVNGTFDDCQALVKDALQNQNREKYPLSSANSINLGRLIPQSVYYSWASSQLNEAPIFSVPSGNLGNLTGGILALKSGAPITGFLAAHNKNSFFPEFLSSETVQARSSMPSLSNAMDVGAPSNLERLRQMLDPSEMRSLITGVSISDKETIKTMEGVYVETGYVADPHTAVALAAMGRSERIKNHAGPTVVLATAHPAKYASLIAQTLGIDAPTSKRLDELHAMKREVREIEASKDALREVIER